MRLDFFMTRYVRQDLGNILSKAICVILVFYFLATISLSISTFFRLQVIPTDLVKFSNILLYYCVYCAIPPVALVFSLLICTNSLRELKTKRTKPPALLYLYFLILLCYSIIQFLTQKYVLSEFLYQWIPILLIAIWYKPKGKFSHKKVATTLALVLLVSISMPHLTVFICYNNILAKASSINNETDKAMFISDLIRNTTTFNSSPLRANDDFWKFLLVGVGACGETAMATTTFLNDLNIEARQASFPGEDHAFVEVKIDDNWLILDPGYYLSELLTREERAARRIENIGAISYVIAYVDSSFVELTRYYVPTDTIVIRVTYGGEPLANAQIYLSHKFVNRQLRLPDSTSTFYSDGNGTIVLHMGTLNYNSKAEEYEPYYWIYVDGKNTGYNVTSTGTGKTHFIEIDLVETSFLEIQSSIAKYYGGD